jgi:hypothetical protein
MYKIEAMGKNIQMKFSKAAAARTATYPHSRLLLSLAVFAAAFLFSIYCSAQVEECYKRVPYFQTRKAEKLAASLTRGMGSDSEKVCAIHSWMTHHIKYDLKKYFAYDYTRDDVKKVLRRRKAICLGYADLFNELCRCAGLLSCGVPGYIRNWSTDLNDRFYLDEHIWNAVYVEHEWKLVDVTWDAGHVEFFKQTFIGRIIQVLTLGKVRIYRFKPHFVNAPVNTFYCKSGYYFKMDHIPADPVWQLLEPLQAVEQLERDSAFFLMQRDTGEHPVHDEAFSRRMILAQMSREEKDIADGFSAYKFNHKNHFSVARSYMMMAEQAFNEIDSTITDTLVLRKMCDTVNYRLGMAIRHHDSNAYWLGRQKEELLMNNVKKRSIMTGQNQRLIASTRKAVRNLLRGRILTADARAGCRAIAKRNYTSLRRLERSRRFDLAEYKGGCSAGDTTAARQRISVLLDSLRAYDLEIPRKFSHADSVYDYCVQRISAYAHRSTDNKRTARKLDKIRHHNIDDLDYILRDVKDTLMKHKFSDDALLMTADSACIITCLVREVSRLKNDFDRFCQCRKAIDGEYVKLKKCCPDTRRVSQDYDANLDAYRGEVGTNAQSLYEFMYKFRVINRMCREQIRPSWTEQKAWAQEKITENRLCYWHGKQIRRHHASLSGLSGRQKAWCIVFPAQVQKKKKHLMLRINRSCVQSPPVIGDSR